MSDDFDPSRGVGEPCPPPTDGDVVELPLLLPGWQVTKLETVAHQRGLTAAAMVRYLLRDFLTIAPVQKGVPTP
jgi:hypothetical protein